MRAARNHRLAGLYLVADLSMPDDKLVSAVKAALKGGVQVVQIWNPDMAPSKNLLETCKEIIFATKTAKIPLIVNNNLELAKLLGADGIHFDDFSKSAKDARIILGEHAIVGYTCGNDQSLITRAAEFGADYISFCAVFPSPSVQSCEIVPLESVRRAKELVTIPVFASGGITLQNAHLVMEAGADGLAIASSILRADDPERQADAFRTIINRYLTAE